MEGGDVSVSSVDNRIVEMDLENSKFQAGVNSTLSALDRLKAGLNISSAKTGLDDINASAGRFNLSAISNATDGVSKSFLAMSTVAITALSQITSSAIDTGANIVKSFTIGPISDGFSNYEEQIKATQVILANTAAAGTTLPQVTDTLAELQKYAQLTVYNFSDMAKNIGTFTAAGVDLKTATASIKGIANLAALSGSSTEQASGAMYQLSQAIAAGRVSLQDYNSVVNAGIGGTVFQRALAETAVANGTLSASAVKLSGAMQTVSINGESFRNSISTIGGAPSWLTSKVLTDTLETFTGDLTVAQIQAKGFDHSVAVALYNQGLAAQNAATQVKTFSQLTQSLKEEVAGAYAKVFAAIFGNITDATTLFSGLHTVLENLLTGPINRFADLLAATAALGGRIKIINGLVHVFKFLGAALTPIEDAFHQIFPGKSAEQLKDIAKSFNEFARTLHVSDETAKGIKNTFGGLFAVFDIFGQILSGVVKYLVDFVYVILGGTGSVFQLTGSFGSLLIKIDQFLKKGQYIAHFFDGLISARDSVLKPLIATIKDLITAIAYLLTGNIKGFVNSIKSAFGGVGDLIQGVAGDITHTLGVIGNLVSKLGGPFDVIGNKIKSFAVTVQKVFTGASDAVNKSGFSSLANIDFSGALSKILPIINKIKSALGGVSLNGVGNQVSGAAKSASNSVKQVFTSGFAKDLPGVLESFGHSVIDGIKIVIANLKPIAASIGQVLVDGFNYLVKNGPQIASSIGKTVGSALAGIIVAIPAIATAIGVGLYEGVVAAFKNIGPAIHNILSKINIGKALSGTRGTSGKIFDPIVTAGDKIKSAWDNVISVFTKAKNVVSDVVSAVVNKIKSINSEFKAFTGHGLTFQGILDTINDVLKTGLLLTLVRFFNSTKKLVDVFADFAAVPNRIVGVFKETSEGLIGIAKTGVKAELILSIAIALAVLAGSLFLLSRIDPKALGIALGAVTATLIEMVIAMKVIFKTIDKFKGVDYKSIIAIGLAMDFFAGALLLMAGAVYLFSKLSYKEIGKGLASITATLAIMVGTVLGLNKSGGTKGILSASIALGILAFALTALAGTIKLYSLISTKTLAEGGAKVAATLIAMGIALRFLPTKTSIKSVFVLAGAALALLIVAKAVQTFASISTGGVIKSIILMGATLSILVASLEAMQETALGAAALIVAAYAIKILAGAMKVFADLSPGQIVKSLIELFGALLILAAAMAVMQEVAVGALAMIVVAGAVAILAPALVILGSLSFGEIGKGLLALAGAFTVLGLAAAILGPLSPIIVALAASIALIGAGVYGVGAGVLALATGLEKLSQSGKSGFEALNFGVYQFIKTLPLIAVAFGQALVAFANVIGNKAPQLVAAFTNLIAAFLKSMDRLIPKFQRVASDLILAFLKTIRQTVPAIVKTGIVVINSLLNGIDKNIVPFTNKAIDIVVKFANTLGQHAAPLVNAGIGLIQKLAQAVIGAIGRQVGNIGTQAGAIGRNIISGIVGAIYGGIGAIGSAIRSVAVSAFNSFKSHFKINSPSKVFYGMAKSIPEGVAGGMTDPSELRRINTASGVMADTAFNSFEKKSKDHTKKLTETQKNYQAFGQAIAANILQGITDFTADNLGSAVDTYVDNVNTALGKIKDDVKDAKDKLNDLTSKKGKDRDEGAIAKARRELNKLIKEEKDASNNAKAHTDQVKNQKDALVALGKQYEANNALLGAATDKSQTYYQQLEDFQSRFDDLQKSVSGAFNVTPDIDKSTSVSSYTKSLQTQIDKTTQFQTALDTLRREGLDDDTYQKLAGEGIDALPFVTKLVAAGPAAVAQISSLTGRLKSAADTLGTDVAGSMYQASINAVQGLINGLIASNAALEAQMATLATNMITVVKKKHKTKSPSREFAQLGTYAALGLIVGLKASTQQVNDASSDMANAALDGLQTTLAKVKDAVQNNIDATPVIAPVLDLTQLQKDATQIGTLLDTTPVQANFSTSQASAINAAQNNQNGSDSTSAAPTTLVQLTQNNTSPKALSNVEIYRSTKNLISMTKEALSI